MVLRLLALCILIASGTARAQNLPPNAAERPAAAELQHTEVIGAFEADSLGNRSLYLDSTFAPFGGIDQSGFRFRATMDADWYRFVASENPRIIGTGRDVEGGLLAGYEVSFSNFNITGLLGPAFGEIVNEGEITQRFGAQAAIETYATPTDWTVAAASVSYSTIANYLQVQAKAGVKIWGDAYLGPDAKFAWQRILPFQVGFPTTLPVSSQPSVFYTHLGAQISAAKIGPVSIGVSGGWAFSEQLGSGYYGGANLYLPF
jgi:hypothetical protein